MRAYRLNKVLANIGLILFLTLLSSSLFAQLTISRISTASRSDGKGYVVRLHIDAPTDSIQIGQPTSSLIQLELFGKGIDYPWELNTSSYDKPFADIFLTKTKRSVGLNIMLEGDQYYIANAYPDQNGKDVLVALTKCEYTEIDPIIKNSPLKEWSLIDQSSSLVQSDKEPLPVPDTEVLQTVSNPPATTSNAGSNDAYDNIKDKVKFDVVVLDAGHGGKDPGAIGYKRSKEKDVVLKVIKRVGEYINQYMPDVKVVYTRDDDTFIGLEERGQIANKVEGDLFVSIHCNSAGARSAHGTEVFFLGKHKSEAAKQIMLKENSVVKYEQDYNQKTTLSSDELAIYELMNSGFMAKSQELAIEISDQFKNRAQRRSRGVKQAGFMVLWHASMPSVLIELGFLSNPSEEKYLNSEYGQKIIASAIFRSIRNYRESFEKSQHYNTKK